MTASTTVPLALVVHVTVVIGSIKLMMFKFPTDEECLTCKQTKTHSINIENKDRSINIYTQHNTLYIKYTLHKIYKTVNFFLPLYHGCPHCILLCHPQRPV